MATQQHSASADGTREPLDPPPTSGADPYATLPHSSDPDATRDFVGSLPGVTPAMCMGWPTIDDYEILAELGRGGMGVVYKARQISLNRIVAIKRVLSGSNIGWEELNRFRGEAEAVAQLQHPNIVQVYEIGESGGSPYFSLEFVDGGSLEKQFAATPQPPADAARTIAILARAIHFAHGKGIVHRDLKPANALLALDGTLKVTDFGLAKRLDDDSGHTRSGAIMGTPSYMAPEQAYGKSNEIGPVADIYALGAVLYAALTGHPPFRGATAWETVEQVRTQEPVPSRRIFADVPLIGAR